MNLAKSIANILLGCVYAGILASGSASPQVNVWTHRYDNARTGANLAEAQLNASSVNPNQFGKLFSYAVDADIYTQPLVILNVAIPGKGTHNVVYVATNNNSVYAFDADNNQGANALPLWQVNFNGPNVTPIPATDFLVFNTIRTPGPIGIMGTPVIDQSTDTMYLVARTKETIGSTVNYVQRLHALDIHSGAEKFGGPKVIQASVPGTGYDSASGFVTFNPGTHNQRAGLALANGNVYIAWASYEDRNLYHGWIMAYNATTLQQVGALCITPNGRQAGIWQSGQPLSADSAGNLYVATGNGTFDAATSGIDFGQSILKLNANLTVLDWFTPYNWANLNSADLDLGSAGVLLIPNTNDLIAGGKDGRFYLLDRFNLGHTQTGNGQVLQTFVADSAGNLHGAPAYWSGPNGRWIYVWGEKTFLKAYAFNGSVFGTTPISQSTYTAPPGMPGGFLTISANGSQAGSGILWASIPYAEDANEEIVSGVLRAFDASNLTRELWNTRMVPARDDLGNFAKFVPPTVANGRVYLPSFSNRLHVYGLLASMPPATGGNITGSGTISTAAVNLTATGGADWAHWPDYDGKSAQISDYAFLGPLPSAYSGDPRSFSWNDGTPRLCEPSSTEGVSISGTNNGFLITVPADTATRNLKLYVGGSNSRGMLTAHLSDGSAPDFVDTGFSSTGQYDVVYTLSYHAAFAGQQLTVVWSQFSGAGTVTLQAAALNDSVGTPSPPGCIWVEDAVPTGAKLFTDRGDAWNWISSNPTPYSGALAHQSVLGSGEHQHSFSLASTMLPVDIGDTLFAYVYLDPANVPSEVMLQWYDGSWEHRAYWGANLIAWGTDGTASRRSMGPLPVAGQWVQLAVPAALVGLEGRTLNGMAFVLYNGRATWDYAGKISGVATTYQISGAVTLSGPGLSGVSLAAGSGASCTSTDSAGNYACTVPQGWSGTVTPSLSGYTFAPASRSYSNVTANQTAQNYTATAAPTYQIGGAVTLSGAGLSGVSLAAGSGASCTSTDSGGNYACTVPQGWTGTVTPSQSGYTFTPSSRSYSNVTANQTSQSYAASVNSGSTIWVEDAVPAGAGQQSDGGDAWTWIGANPAPFSGALAHQSTLASGEHQHYFYNATNKLTVAVGDVLFAYVYLDPANPPSEVMLQWYDGSWEHRAYWGANLIGWGTNGTTGRRSMGALPAAGQWVQLMVPAAQVGLEGRMVSGMAFTLYGGRATWDYAGK